MAAAGWYIDRVGARYAYVPIGRGKRINVHLVTCTTDAQAAARASIVRELAKVLRDAGRDEFLEKIVDEAAHADDERLASIRRIVDGIVKGTERKGASWMPSPTRRGRTRRQGPDENASSYIKYLTLRCERLEELLARGNVDARNIL